MIIICKNRKNMVLYEAKKRGNCMKKQEKAMDIDQLKDGVYFAARGGGIRSCVSIGVLKALEEAKIPIKGVCGESLSSIFAALYAYGYNAEEIMDLFLRYNRVLTRASKLYGGRGSIVIEEEVNKVTDGIQMKDLERNCFINACAGKLLKPELVLFSKATTPNETLGTACRASASLPIVFGRCNKTVNGKEYSMFDGGLLYNPYVPETNYPILYASFYNYIDYYKIIPALKRTIDAVNNRADVIVYAPVGKTLVLGSNEEMKKAAEAGYEDAKRLLKI